MVSDEEILAYLLRRGILWPSIAMVRRDFPRWRTRLSMMGVSSLDPLVTNKTMNLIINQAIKKASPVYDRSTNHRLRNESGMRPPKP